MRLIVIQPAVRSVTANLSHALTMFWILLIMRDTLKSDTPHT